MKVLVEVELLQAKTIIPLVISEEVNKEEALLNFAKWCKTKRGNTAMNDTIINFDENSIKEV